MADAGTSVSMRLVDAFTDTPMAGTPTVVVRDDGSLSADQLDRIASEFGDRTTAAYEDRADDPRLTLRIGRRSVHRCDWAAIAAVATADSIDPGSHTLETPHGPLGVQYDETGRAWVAQPDATVEFVGLEYDRLAGALGVPEAGVTAFEDELELAVVETRASLLMVPVTYLEHLGAMRPDEGAIREITREVSAAGLFAFSFDTLHGSTIHGRTFAPDATTPSLPRDPADPAECLPNGTEAGTAAAYLQETEAFGEQGPTDVVRTGPDEVRVEVGHFLDRPARIDVRTGTGIQIGGHARTILSAAIDVPPPDSDDITVA